MYFISNGTVELYENDDDSEAKKILRPRDKETLFNSQFNQFNILPNVLITLICLCWKRPESIQVISSIVGRGWGVNYLHRSKAR